MDDVLERALRLLSAEHRFETHRDVRGESSSSASEPRAMRTWFEETPLVAMLRMPSGNVARNRRRADLSICEPSSKRCDGGSVSCQTMSSYDQLHCRRQASGRESCYVQCAHACTFCSDCKSFGPQVRRYLPRNLLAAKTYGLSRWPYGSPCARARISTSRLPRAGPTLTPPASPEPRAPIPDP